jgi:hypothetical protein
MRSSSRDRDHSCVPPGHRRADGPIQLEISQHAHNILILHLHQLAHALVWQGQIHEFHLAVGHHDASLLSERAA